MKHSADIYDRAHQQAANILKDIGLIGGFVSDSVKELGLQLELLDATQEFTSNARGDVTEAISRVKELPASLTPLIEQLSIDLDVISRGLTETTGLAKQARGRLKTAEEYLQDTEAQAQAQVSLAANIKTLREGQEYLFTDKSALKRVIRLVGVKVIRDVLEEVERGE